MHPAGGDLVPVMDALTDVVGLRVVEGTERVYRCQAVCGADGMAFAGACGDELEGMTSMTGEDIYCLSDPEFRRVFESVRPGR